MSDPLFQTYSKFKNIFKMNYPEDKVDQKYRDLALTLANDIQGFRDLTNREKILELNTRICFLWGIVPKPVTNYLQSRDALFNARPPGYFITIHTYDQVTVSFYKDLKLCAFAKGETEQIAEAAALVLLKEYIKNGIES